MLPTNECTGCSACYHNCPKSCISMHPDKHGFLYPKKDNTVCVNCGLCKKTCPVLNATQKEQDNSQVVSYAAKATDEDIRSHSSSGGIFSLIAKKTFDNNGIVYGAAFDENFVVKHIGISSVDELDLLRRSKYVQSDLNNAFEHVKSNLNNGKAVLFTGTPCQVEGLLSYLKKPYDNLTTMDFVCHGVPAPNVWEHYKKHLQKKYNSPIADVNFRDKSSGWKKYSVRIEFKNGESYCSVVSADPYMKAFLMNFDLRDSCYTCKFKSTHHKSDITVADFWGIDRTSPDIDDDKGLSLVLINTEKGSALITEMQNQLTITEMDIEKAISYNPCIVKAVPMHNFRQYFLTNYTKGNFTKNVESCLNPSYITRFKRKLLQAKNGDA